MLKLPIYLFLSLSVAASDARVQRGSGMKNPHILIILVDDLGYGDPGCFNPQSKIPTPHIDRLAKQGMRFTDAHAPGPLCHLSRYGLLTGRYPFRTKTGSWNRRAVIQPDEVTIASFLKANGYRTSMVGKWHLGFDENGYENPLPGGPVDRGFDSFFGIRASTDIPPYFYIRDRRAVQAPTRSIEARKSEGWSPIQGEFWRAGLIAPDLQLNDVLPRFTDEAVEVINDHARNKSNKPLMLYLALPAPHTPWLPDSEFVGESGAGMYGDFVMMVDAMIGRVLDALDRAKMTQSTMVIFTSDNGPVWYERDVQRFGHDCSGGLRGMKADAWEAGHRMPFIVHWPEQLEDGSTCDQLICFTDLLATFADLIGVRLPDGAGPDSYSFLPALLGDGVSHGSSRTSLVMASGNKMMSIRSGEWKLIDGLGSGGFSKPGRVKPKTGEAPGQLYNLSSDPAETTNLYSDYPEVVARLTRELESETAKRPENPTVRPTINRPNIVLVMSDDQGWGQTGYNNHPILNTPNLDAMAAAGLRFERFYAAGPVCSPTRASVLTGRTHRRAGVESHGFALRRQEKTIAALLRDKGYATAHFGKWHLNGLRGPGVPIFAEDTHHPGVFGFQSWLSVSNFFDVDPILSRNGQFEEFKGDSSEIIVDEAIKFIRRQKNANVPFLTVIWYGTPHSPFRCSDEDARPFSHLDQNSANQLGELVAMDRSIGTLRSALREMKIENNTIFWFTSDNGGLGRMKPDTVGGLRGNKGSLYEGGIRVPTIVQWPDKIKPRITQYPSTSMDILPTIADIVGISQSEMIQPQDGISLVGLFDRELERRERPIPFSYMGNAALIDNNLKLLRTSQKNEKEKRWELYDLDADSAETTNLIESRPETAERMKKEIQQITQSLQRSIKGLDYPERSVKAGEPGPQSWLNVPAYKPWFDEWSNRPEYRSRLKTRLEKR